MKEYTVQEDVTLKKFTDEVCAQASFAFRTLLKEKKIRVNGERVGQDVPLLCGDRVQYFLTPAQEQKTAFTILYEDENVAVIDKESGVNAEAVCSALGGQGARLVHRLDRNTEGLMILAKNAVAEEELLCAFRERRVQKVYLAVVVGNVKAAHAVEEAYLVKDERAARVSVSSSPRGEKIVTEYDVLERKGGFSLLRVTLHTGKTHQIRAHLAFLGYPVLGDEKYGAEEVNRAYHAKRQRLLSKELTLTLSGGLSYLNGKTFVSPKNLSIPQKNA